MDQHVYHEASVDQLSSSHIAPQTCYIDSGPQVVGISYQDLQQVKLAAQQEQQYAVNHLICGPHKLAVKQDQTQQQTLQQQIQQKQTSAYQTQQQQQQRQMTDAEKLKADKEQLKLNLQNFRKTQKTVKQIQMAKQSAAAIQAQKSSNNGLNSTYQAFDLQNYKSPEDCIIGLQSAKKMLQQSSVFQGTQTTNPATATNLTTELENMGQVYGTANPVNQANKLPTQHQVQMVQRPPPAHHFQQLEQAAQLNQQDQHQSTLQKKKPLPPHHHHHQQKQQYQQQQLSSRQLQAMSTHQPPPPQARRKRGHREQHKENTTTAGVHGGNINNSSSSMLLPMMSLQNQAAAASAVILPPSHQHIHRLQQMASSGGRRQGRFVPSRQALTSAAAAQSSQQTPVAAFSQQQAQNVHPNLPASSGHHHQFQPAPPSPANQPTNQSDRNYNGAGPGLLLRPPQERLPQKSVNKQTSIMANAYFTEQQLHKIASCLNYDQGEICRLFQQKYNELIMLNQQQSQSKGDDGDGDIDQQLVEPNLSLFFQLVQNDLIAKQQKQQQQQQEQSTATSTATELKQQPFSRKKQQAVGGKTIIEENPEQQLSYQLLNNQAAMYDVNSSNDNNEATSQDLAFKIGCPRNYWAANHPVRTTPTPNLEKDLHQQYLSYEQNNHKNQKAKESSKSDKRNMPSFQQKQNQQQHQKRENNQKLSKASSSSNYNNNNNPPSQTVSSSEQQSVSSTLAVIMGSDDIGYCEEDDDIDSSSCCGGENNNDDDDQYQHSQNPSNLMISDYDYQEVDEDEDDADGVDENYDKSVNSLDDGDDHLDCREPIGCCYGADATEAYESYEEQQHQNHTIQQQQQQLQHAHRHHHPPVYHQQQQQMQQLQHQYYDIPASCDLKYHQFSQSDYVEAVEGFTAEDDVEVEVDDDDGEASGSELNAARQCHKIAYLQTSGGRRCREMIQGEEQCCVDDDDDDEDEDENEDDDDVVMDLYEDEQEIDEDVQGDEFLDDDDAEGQAEDEQQQQYIEEDDEHHHHQFTLNQLSSQAHKQLVNGFGPSANFLQNIHQNPNQQQNSQLQQLQLQQQQQQQQQSIQKVSQSKEEEDAHTWQSLYPRLFNDSGGITPQSLEQMINLGQANMTPYQAQEILNFQQKQLRQGMEAAADGNQQHQSDNIMLDEDGNQQAYEWCSQDSFEESNQDGEIEHNHDTIQSSRQRTSESLDSKMSDNYNVVYQDDLSQNLIHSTLQPPSHLSPAFKRFFTEFENNIDFILRSDYEILPQLRTNSICKAEQKRLKIKYENLLTASRDMCRRFTGPHSVLQVFIEKIVASIKIIAQSLKESTKNEFGLWTEVHIPITADAQQHQKRKLNTNSSSLLIGHHKRSSSANPELLITKKSKSNEQQAAANQDDEDDDDEADGGIQPAEEQAYIVELRPKPLLSCIDRYTEFLNELRAQYILIMTNCAPKISKHFTKLTAVIVENTQYEFPSAEIHKAVISKLILNDERCFKQLVQHMQSEFRLNEAQIRRDNQEFLNALDLFIREVDDDMRANQTKIDIYMRDLRKHALDEYEDLYNDEQDQIRLGRNVDGKKKRQRQKKKNRKKKERQAATAGHCDDINDEQEDQLQQENTNNNNNAAGAAVDETATIPSSANQMTDSADNEATINGKKKKRNRRSKNKANPSVTNELLNNLDTDDLVDFINNCGSKKEDLKKQASAIKAASPEEKQQIAVDQSQSAVEPFNNSSQANENCAANEMQNDSNPNQNQSKTDANVATQDKDQNGKIDIENNTSTTPQTVPKQSKKQKRGKKNKLKKLNDQTNQAIAQSTISTTQQQSPIDQIYSSQVIDEPQKDSTSGQKLQNRNPAADQSPSSIKVDQSNDDEDLEEVAAADIQLEAFKEGLVKQAAIQYFGMKMKPNVSNQWLRKVHQRLIKVNKALALASCKPDAKRQSASAY